MTELNFPDVERASAAAAASCVTAWRAAAAAKWTRPGGDVKQASEAAAASCVAVSYAPYH